MDIKTIRAIALAACAGFFMASPSWAEDSMHQDGMHKKGRMAEKMMERMDENKDGTVSHDEFIKSHETRFKEMDANADSSLSKEELEAYGMAMKKKREEMREMMKQGGAPDDSPQGESPAE